LEDLASANGCYLNGRRITEEVTLAWGDEICVGPYRMLLLEGAESSPSIVPGAAAGMEALPGPSLPGLRADEPAAARDFDVAADEEEVPASSGSGIHAGLVLQRGGRLVRVLSWDRDRLCVGRSPGCDIVLSAPSVSRRHALLVRQKDGFEVWDLESANGTWVNGTRVGRKVLSVDDDIAIGEYQLTLLIDTLPIDCEVVAEAPASTRNAPGESRCDMTVFGDPEVEEVGGEHPAQEEVAEPKELEPAEALVSRAGEASSEARLAAAGGPSADGVEEVAEASLLLELAVRSEQLPPALRRWLETSGGELRLPMELRLRRKD
jgi:predicted component of type VI protein secretion system